MLSANSISDPSWRIALKDYFESDTFKMLTAFLEDEYKTQTIYPTKEDVFTALNLTPLQDVKVVILGQDPYHGPNQAHGLAFSVKSPCKPPPSLKNIFKELEINPPEGDLTSWAKQGVFLINTVLTVRASQAHSHKNRGWEEFTDAVIKILSKRDEPIIFVLWGAPAQKKKELIKKHHYILESPHPSPLSAYRGFFGCDHFNLINKILRENQQKEITWQLGHSLTQPSLFELT
ncbi:MAG: uracil-DNA glycosylase [Lentisphaeraceae bacterium]|nr:uracil-DNA glycosylase [Lentisphaeraceae bacterium]